MERTELGHSPPAAVHDTKEGQGRTRQEVRWVAWFTIKDGEEQLGIIYREKREQNFARYKIAIVQLFTYFLGPAGFSSSEFEQEE